MRKTLLLAGFILALAGCASAPTERVTKVLPPASLAQACQEPAGDVSTNGGLASYARVLKDALSGCAAQVDGLRAWLEAENPTAKNP